MPLLLKVLALMLKSRRGRELLFAIGLGAYEVARSPKARDLYGKTQAFVADSGLPGTLRRSAGAAVARAKRIRR